MLSELDFLKRYPNYAFRAISGFYPLSGEQLKKYRHVLFWRDIYENEEIDWSVGLIQTFLKYLKDEKGKLNSILHYNNKLPWSVELIKQFESLWYWDILGKKSQIQHSELIQKIFEQHLKPVNAWITSINSRFADSRKEALTFDKVVSIKPVQWTREEIEKHKDKLDWFELSIDGNQYNWNFEFLIAFEKHIDFGALTGNREAWVNCFGKLNDADIEALLGDKELQAKVDYSEKIIKMDDIERSHFKIPECLTFEYFITPK